MPDDQISITGITGSSTPATIPQFSTAEYAKTGDGEQCQFCSKPIVGEYYRVNNLMACTACAEQAKAGMPKDSHSAYIKGLLFGCGAAVLGLILYATVSIVTGWNIGYVSLAVGWLVATGMVKGSNGMGGRKYQIAAMVLTYFAISLAAVPIMINQMWKERPAHTAQVQSAPAATTEATADTTAGQAAPNVQTQPATDASVATTQQPTESQATQPTTAKPKKQLGLVMALGWLLLIGVISPFLELQSPLHGLIGLFILFIGLRIAWRMTAAKALDVDGPYGATSQAG
jgi:hypothetical protein